MHVSVTVLNLLGPVHNSRIIAADKSIDEMQHGHKSPRKFLAACGQSPEPFDTIEESLKKVAVFVNMLIVFSPNNTVFSTRDDRLCVSRRNAGDKRWSRIPCQPQSPRLQIHQLEQIKAVAMDMWEPYFEATLKHVPGAAGRIVHDRFHIIKHVGEAVDRVRKHEHRELLAQEDHRFKRTKYLWLYREENVPDKHRPALEAANLKVAKAWAMKESLNDVWNYLSSGWDRRFVKRWLVWVNKSDLAPMRKVGEMIQRHLGNILTFGRHRITNGVAEGLSSKIMAIKRNACGSRNRDHFKTASDFFCGGLDLYPTSS